MAVERSADRAELFARYEAALKDLADVPGRLARELANATATHDSTRATAGAAAKRNQEQLAALRRTLTSGYHEQATALRAANISVPQQVRAVPGRRGDADALSAAVAAQREAEKAVAVALRAAARAAEQQTKEEQARAAAALDAAAALRRRQEQILRARQEAEDPPRIEQVAEVAAGPEPQDDGAHAKRQRQAAIVTVAALLLLIAAAALLLT
ncbi:hypothetical protein [Nocardia higoensis]|uniref:hypothetical protein n=1 Tax=Nocardia higoensis TaxID=228599 RepID=UPI0002DB8252|nr:hypothetical protein [Nocardia higoensis]